MFSRPIELDAGGGAKGAKGSGRARAKTQTPQAEEQISYDEVQKHNTREDCWIVIRGQVSYLSMPPIEMFLIDMLVLRCISKLSLLEYLVDDLTQLGVVSITDFIPKHPGGAKPILANAGKDVTSVIHQVHNCLYLTYSHCTARSSNPFTPKVSSRKCSTPLSTLALSTPAQRPARIQKPKKKKSALLRHERSSLHSHTCSTLTSLKNLHKGF